MKAYQLPIRVLAAIFALISMQLIAHEPAQTNASNPDFASQFAQQHQQTIAQRMQQHQVPGMSIAIIENNQIIWTKGFGLKQVGSKDQVDTNTVFSVGSVSKVAAAVATLRLVAQQKLELDKDVNQYLSQWKVPQNRYTRKQAVTLRHLMSHTAGFNVHGFGDFQPGAKLPTTLDTLNGRAPAKHDALKVEFTPGSQFRYSGGGTTVEQLIIEETTKQDFVSATQNLVFKPLAMNRSTYLNPLPPSHGNIAKAHNRNGQPTALPRGWEAMPEMAASGLWTTPTDLAKMMIALIKAHQGKTNDFLPQALVQDMMTPVSPSQFGLGPQLYDDFFYHGGANDSYRAFIKANLKTGTGIVVLTNGSNGSALAREMVEFMNQLQGWS